MSKEQRKTNETKQCDADTTIFDHRILLTHFDTCHLGYRAMQAKSQRQRTSVCVWEYVNSSVWQSVQIDTSSTHSRQIVSLSSFFVRSFLLRRTNIESTHYINIELKSIFRAKHSIYFAVFHPWEKRLPAHCISSQHSRGETKTTYFFFLQFAALKMLL